MTLNVVKKTQLEWEYDSLAVYMDSKVAWNQLKQEVIEFCVNEEIELYRLKDLPHVIAKELASEFIALLPQPSGSEIIADGQHAIELEQRLQWKSKFEKICAEATLLQGNYHKLGTYVRDPSAWFYLKETVLLFCLREEIHLYDIVTLRYAQAEYLMNLFVELISVPLDREFLGDKQFALEVEKRQEWKRRYLAFREQSDAEMHREHRIADLSVGHQFIRTGQIRSRTLLTFQDMDDLLSDEKFNSPDILKSKPFPLTELAPIDAEPIQTLIDQVEKDVFLPIVHEGHWIYLLRTKGEWSIHDSQPFADGSIFSNDGLNLTERQRSIYMNCIDFLAKMHREQDFGAVVYLTSGQQPVGNDYECGTHVVTAWRMLADRDYVKPTHDQILMELLNRQVPNWRELKQSREANRTSSHSASSHHGMERLDGTQSSSSKEASGEKENHQAAMTKTIDTMQGLSQSTVARRDKQETGVGTVGRDSELGEEEIKRLASVEAFDPSSNLRRTRPESSNGRSDLPPTTFTTQSFTIPTEREKEFLRRIAELDNALEELLNKAEEFKEIKQAKIKELTGKVEFERKQGRSKALEQNESILSMQEEIKKYEQAEVAARTIHEAISGALVDYKKHPTYESYILFQGKADEVIKAHSHTLATHRNKDKIVAYNILGLIAGLVVFYLAYAAIDYFSDPKRRGCSIWQTDSGKKVNRIEDAVDALNPMQMPIQAF